MSYVDALYQVTEAYASGQIAEWVHQQDHLPAWAVPYGTSQTNHAYAYGLTILMGAALHTPNGETARRAVAEAATSIGHHLGAGDWGAPYVGVPLLAAHLVARGIATATGDDGGGVWSTLLEEYISALWPAVDRAEHPEGILHIALRLRRMLAELNLDGVRGLPELVKLGTVPADTYPAAVMHLLRVIARQDWGIQARERRGRVLATMLAGIADRLHLAPPSTTRASCLS